MIVQYKKCDACGKEFPIDTQLTSAELLGAGAEICDECKAALVGFLSARGKAPVAKADEGAKSTQGVASEDCETASDYNWRNYNFSVSDVVGMDNALIATANSMSKEELRDLSDDDKRAIGEALYYGYKKRTIAEDARKSGRAATTLAISYNGHTYAKSPGLLAIKVFEREYLGIARPYVAKRIRNSAGPFRDAIIRYIKMRLESDAETKDLCKAPRTLSDSEKAIVADHAMQITNTHVRQNQPSDLSGCRSKYRLEAFGLLLYASTPDKCKVRLFDQWVLGVLEEDVTKSEVKTKPKAQLKAQPEQKAEPKPRILRYDDRKLPKGPSLQARLLSKWEALLQAGDTASLLLWSQEVRTIAGNALMACGEGQAVSPFKPRGHYHGTMPRYRMQQGKKKFVLPENGYWGEYIFLAVSGLADEAAKIESKVALAPDYEALWRHASGPLRDCLQRLKKGNTAALLSKPVAEKIAVAKDLRTIFGRKIQIYHEDGSTYTQYAINWGKRKTTLRAKSEKDADIAFYHLVFGLPTPEKDDTPPKKPERKRAIVRKPKERTSLVQVFDGKIEEDALGRVNKCLDAICKTTHLDKKYILSTIYADMERVYGVNLNTMCAQLKQETGSSARVSPFIAIMCDKTLSKIFENKVINKMAELGVESPEDVTKYAQGVIDKHLSEDVL